MKTTITSNKTLTFTINYDIILSSTELTPLNKLVISIVLGWQKNNKECTQSNNSLKRALGVSLRTINYQMVELNKYDWFNSIETSKINEFGKWENSKKIIINEEKLFEFLTNENEITETLPTPVIESIKEEEKAPQIEENIVEIELEDTSKIESNYEEEYDEDLFDDVEEIDFDTINKNIPISRDILFNYVENNCTNFGYAKKALVEMEIEKGNINTITEILNY